MTSSMSDGKARFAVLTLGGGSCKCACIIAICESRGNGNQPVNITYSVQPSE
jgi:hypothetical protein